MRNAAGAIGTARANGKGRLVLWVTLIVGVLALARYLNAQALLQDALRWIQGLGPMGWVISFYSTLQPPCFSCRPSF